MEFAIIDIETSQANPEFWISEVKYGLQEVNKLIKTKRQSTMMAAPYPYSESVIIQKKYEFLKKSK